MDVLMLRYMGRDGSRVLRGNGFRKEVRGWFPMLVLQVVADGCIALFPPESCAGVFW